MTLKVVWSRRAIRNYDELIDTFIEMGQDAKAANLMDRVEEVVFAIKKLPKMFPEVAGARGVRKAVLTEDINLFYQIREKEIALVLLWPSKSDPKALARILARQ